MSASTAFIDARQLDGCRHRLSLDAEGAAMGVDMPESPGARERIDAATAHRERVRDELTANGGWVVIDPQGSPAARAAETMAACAAGAPRIWGALLPVELDTGRRGGAEILFRDDDRGGYLPVIVVNHKVTDPRQRTNQAGSRRPEPIDVPVVTSDVDTWDPRPDLTRKLRSHPRDELRLAHLYRMLQRHGLAGPALVGGVIGVTADCIVVHDLGEMLLEYDRRYGDRISVVRREVPTTPSRVGECRHCPWWSVRCQPQLRQIHDVSLIAPGSRARVLRDAGVNTIDELARWIGGPPDDWPTDDFADVVVAARAWRTGVPLVRRVPAVKIRRADVEVDVDLESFQEHGAYLWGTLLDGDYRPFATWEPVPTDDEARSFGEFWTWLSGVRAQAHSAGKSFAAYCYTRTEDKFLFDSARKFAGRPGIPTVGEVHDLVDSRDWVDLFQVVTDQFICPNGKGLKKIAPISGFAWRDPEAGGEAAMAWYRAAVGYDGDPPDPTQRRRVLEYNEDDVRATAALRSWLTDRAQWETPLASDLPAHA